jgi:hypothetical protein
MTTVLADRKQAYKELAGEVYCYLCTHVVKASVVAVGRHRIHVKPGEKCSRCGASVEAAAVLRIDPVASLVGRSHLN